MRMVGLIAMVLGLACADWSAGEGDGGDSGSGSDSGSESGDVSVEQLEQVCREGCLRFSTCSPDVFATAYPDVTACETLCVDTFDDPQSCLNAAMPYLECASVIDCSEYASLLDGPEDTSCAASWAVAGPACGLI